MTLTGQMLRSCEAKQIMKNIDIIKKNNLHLATTSKCFKQISTGSLHDPKESPLNSGQRSRSEWNPRKK